MDIKQTSLDHNLVSRFGLESNFLLILSNQKLQGWPKAPVVGWSFKSTPFMVFQPDLLYNKLTFFYFCNFSEAPSHTAKFKPCPTLEYPSSKICQTMLSGWRMSISLVSYNFVIFIFFTLSSGSQNVADPDPEHSLPFDVKK